MELNATLVMLLEAYELERLTALVDWLEPEAAHVTIQLSQESQSLESSPPKEEPMMSTLSPLSVIDAQPSSTALALDDLIAFSIVNEFGTSFQGKTCFEWLRECVTRRFMPDASI